MARRVGDGTGSRGSFAPLDPPRGSDPTLAGATRDDYQQALDAAGVSTSIHFLPVHQLTWYRERFPDQPPLPVAERGGSEVLSLPLSPAHSDDTIHRVAETLRAVHERFAA